MKELVFVTGNAAKAQYFSKLFGIEVAHQKVGLTEIQSTDIKQITEDKAMRAYQIIKKPVIVEDVGLYFEALGSLPGPFIKFFVDEENGLEKLCRMLDGFSTRRAYAVVITTYYDGQKFTHFEGGARGEVPLSPRGEGGFGYDKVWCVDGYDGKTRAELSASDDDKSYIDARPFQEMRDFFNQEVHK